MLLLLAFALPVALPLTRGLLSTCRLDGLLFDDLDACLDSTADSTRVVAAAARWDGRGRDAAQARNTFFYRPIYVSLFT